MRRAAAECKPLDKVGSVERIDGRESPKAADVVPCLRIVIAGFGVAFIRLATILSPRHYRTAHRPNHRR